MKRYLLAILFMVLGLLAAVPAADAQPSPVTSVVPSCLRLVGHAGGVTDPLGNFVVQVNDAASNPVPGAVVQIDFTACAGDPRVGAPQLFPGNVWVPPCLVTAVTNAAGTARFLIDGGGRNQGHTPPIAPAQCAQVLANGVLLGRTTVLTLDEDGVGGVGPNDLAAWLGDLFSPLPIYYPRSDFDCNGAMGANDLAVWLAVFFGAGSLQSAVAYAPCP